MNLRKVLNQLAINKKKKKQNICSKKLLGKLNILLMTVITDQRYLHFDVKHKT